MSSRGSHTVPLGVTRIVALVVLVQVAVGAAVLALAARSELTYVYGKESRVGVFERLRFQLMDQGSPWAACPEGAQVETFATAYVAGRRLYIEVVRVGTLTGPFGPHDCWSGQWKLTAPLLPISGSSAGIAVLLVLIPRVIRRRRAATSRCLKCGYSLIGNVSGRCPECGSITGGRAPAEDCCGES